MKRGLVALLVPFLVTASAANWTDRAEYDLVLRIRAEAVPKQKLELLGEWKTKYPKSEYQQIRREMLLATYQPLEDSRQMFAVASEMLASQPDNFVGLFWCTVLIPTMKDATPSMMTIGEQAARQLLSNLDKHFGPANKPPDIADQIWRDQKSAAGMLAHRSIGWIRWQLADYPVAEQEFTECLRQNPKEAETSSWLGTMLAGQKEPEKRMAAIWHVARAASLRGEGALPEGQQRQMNTLLDHLYSTYHGEGAGLDQVRVAAVASAMPTAEFSVEPAGVTLNRTANPQLAEWLKIRWRLEWSDGEKYFNETLKVLPLPKLKGTLVRTSPANKPEQLVLAISDSAVEEVTLKLSTPFPHDAPVGTELQFEGTADSFTRNPFSLTILVERAKIEGWPAAAAGTKPRPRQ